MLYDVLANGVLDAYGYDVDNRHYRTVEKLLAPDQDENEVRGAWGMMKCGCKSGRAVRLGGSAAFEVLLMVMDS